MLALICILVAIYLNEYIYILVNKAEDNTDTISITVMQPTTLWVHGQFTEVHVVNSNSKQNNDKYNSCIETIIALVM